jgi:hypothetical protein
MKKDEFDMLAQDIWMAIINTREQGQDENKGTVEVKTERDIWKTSGNIVFEVRYKGKLSGISKTKADYWAHILSYKGEIKSILMFPTDVLKSQLKHLMKTNKAETIYGGDNNDSEMIRVPIKNMYSK